MEYLAKYDCYVREIELPMRIRGFATELNGERFIFLNGNLSSERKIRTLKHELGHLEANDLYSREDANEIEDRYK